MNMHDPKGLMLSAALQYAAMGWEVFPAPPGEKKSYKAEKFSGAKWGKSNDPNIIREDFRKWPKANVAIVTGAASGIFVIEADTLEGHGVDGLASINELEAKYGPFPETLKAISPSGSIHRYYRHPGPGIKIWNSDSMIAPGVDIRGDGGMVIAPPSIKPGAGAYKWLNDAHVAEAPVWLIELASKSRERKPHDYKLSGAGNPFADFVADFSRGGDLGPEAAPELIAAALEYIPNGDDVGYGEWVNIGMAAWRATRGSGIAFAAFDRWSQKSSKHYDAKNTAAKWASFFTCQPTSVGAGTVFKMASDNGWVRQSDERAKDQADDTDAHADTIISQPPGMGHNSKGKKPLHIVIATIFIDGMQKGVGQLLRRVPDLKGNDHVWRYRDGLWSLPSDICGRLSATPTAPAIRSMS